jgi:hypothetical protein
MASQRGWFNVKLFPGSGGMERQKIGGFKQKKEFLHCDIDYFDYDERKQNW